MILCREGSAKETKKQIKIESEAKSSSSGLLLATSTVENLQNTQKQAIKSEAVKRVLHADAQTSFAFSSAFQSLNID
jgi:hypothetical protein